jgi:hypothetical protein
MPNVLVRELGASVPSLLEPFVEHVGLALGSVAVVVLASRGFSKLRELCRWQTIGLHL